MGERIHIFFRNSQNWNRGGPLFKFGLAISFPIRPSALRPRVSRVCLFWPSERWLYSPTHYSLPCYAISYLLDYITISLSSSCGRLSAQDGATPFSFSGNKNVSKNRKKGFSVQPKQRTFRCEVIAKIHLLSLRYLLLSSGCTAWQCPAPQLVSHPTCNIRSSIFWIAQLVGPLKTN